MHLIVHRQRKAHRLPGVCMMEQLRKAGCLQDKVLIQNNNKIKSFLLREIQSGIDRSTKSNIISGRNNPDVQVPKYFKRREIPTIVYYGDGYLIAVLMYACHNTPEAGGQKCSSVPKWNNDQDAWHVSEPVHFEGVW